MGQDQVGYRGADRALLLLTPQFNWLGSAQAMGMMLGAIASHMTILGLEVQGDKRLLFGLALAVFFATGINSLVHRGEMPIIGRRLA